MELKIKITNTKEKLTKQCKYKLKQFCYKPLL
ncbi:hypothetical protein HWC92_gp11 [Flavobacterium phage vB_FspS_morran9-1]|uniref:Uncharacterized protein n=15 Tax=Lillamyvirus TaxID=2843418 RepID=A0A6B9LAQ8_9CAUD|nr:hypothetical protein HWC89_gp09 [Flavobacterium phage vB_FspS_hemulen6-1]YP_009854866.1 hypothetical protein HWC91_gp11 [Flavobacterium phage vB_FspS_lillamy9-1]YP_009854939.1 hypothetical protein HWC92_gp11 [Flavobacterium phage vB_FspS_morran9-1]YP_009855146.1 hypothetical protein HWC95_gp10 [Flavobacterium phage vB_FspS_sniff9-1]YP_009855221.1 hypothetical protein HWC96_gp11 [Flavobacterium phage vB_FspS_snork6-1]YP_009855364.1 hypothetical protein HWC98_gp09 [Flavobacterium phage vB_Fsp